ncbi:MAG: hypothetical protein OQL06_06645 [Gammaproteobacteria bacterium]|nr:hypothetical protein [Gammaproteobacteria bacterium]
MADKKLLLRVSVKLMAWVGIAFIVYILFSGLMGNDNDASQAEILLLDITDLKPGHIKYFPVDRRNVLVLFRTEQMIRELQGSSANRADEELRSVIPEYFVAYAYDPFYGCNVEMAEGFLQSVCVDVKYDFAGKVYQSDKSAVDLIVPEYEIIAGKFIKLHLN